MNNTLKIPQGDVFVSAGKKIGERIIGPWLENIIDKAVDTIEAAIKKSKHEY